VENRFIIDLKDKLGTGSFGDVFRGTPFPNFPQMCSLRQKRPRPANLRQDHQHREVPEQQVSHEADQQGDQDSPAPQSYRLSLYRQVDQRLHEH
jgi:hypothetical protein